MDERSEIYVKILSLGLIGIRDSAYQGNTRLCEI